MKSYESLSPDGFQPFFYKLFWDVVWLFVKNAFESVTFDTKVVETLFSSAY